MILEQTEENSPCLFLREKRIQAMPAISKLVHLGKNPEEILTELFGKEEFKVLEKLPVQFRCTCSKERIKNAIGGLDLKELDEMIEVDEGAEASCHFCNERYEVTKEELIELKQSKEI